MAAGPDTPRRDGVPGAPEDGERVLRSEPSPRAPRGLWVTLNAQGATDGDPGSPTWECGPALRACLGSTSPRIDRVGTCMATASPVSGSGAPMGCKAQLSATVVLRTTASA